ncbi:hypothetical protein L1049_002331 [Liquidambar formosana]|uniref:Uncharacterized protein n=1 Tax=Liquidambar formosana TaxID=63359 RepID=A0AAP0R869_LIQFO
MAAYVAVGLPARIPPWSKSPSISKGAGSRRTFTEDICFSSLSFGGSFGFPRIAIAGANPTVFAPRMREKPRVQNEYTEGGYPNKKRKSNPFIYEADKFFNNKNHGDSDVPNSSSRDGKKSYARELLDRGISEEALDELEFILLPVLLKRLKELSETSPPTDEVGLEIADSVHLLMLLNSSNPKFDMAAKKARGGAKLLQEGVSLLIEGLDL